jgi:broad specificity phosphatase PhoE
MTLTLLFARHGETADNRNLVFQGQGGHGLNALGRAQAARLAERMKLVRPDVIVSSDLERAVETATIVATACRLDIETDPNLREVDLGTWTGKSYAEIEASYPEEWAAWTSGLDVRRGGGETYDDLAARVERAVARVASAYPGRRVLLVSHGGAIKSYVATILGVPAEGLRVLAGLGNAGITHIERDARGRSRLQVWNDVAHLQGLDAASGDGSRLAP